MKSCCRFKMPKNMMKPSRGQFWARLSVQFLTVTTLTIAIASVTRFIIRVADKLPAQSSTMKPEVLITEALKSLAPEPVERSMFLICLVSIPILLALFIPISESKKRLKPRWRNDLVDAILCLLTAILLLAPLPGSRAMQVVIGDGGGTFQTSMHHGIKALIIAILTCLLIRSLHLRKLKWRRRTGNQLKLSYLAGCTGIIILIMLSFRLFQFEHLNTSLIWSIHLDAAISSVAQVQDGRTILVDVPSQYGLFPHFLSPLLGALPTGTGSITLIFGILQTSGLIILLLVLKRYVQDASIFLIGSLALLMVTSGTGQILGYRFEEIPDPYFQYWPVRFIMPSLSIPITLYAFGKTKSWMTITGLCCFNALALLWNLDSGVAILYAEITLIMILAIMSFRTSQDICGWELKSLLKYIFAIPALSLFFYGLAILILALSAGKAINTEWIVGYQSIFYALGFMMLPMSARADAWHTIISVYMISLLVGMSPVAEGKSRSVMLPLLYLPLLGSGLFAYYQGRSHFFNLVSVSWPLIIVATILVDQHLRAIKAGLISPLTISLPLAGLTGLLMPAMALVSGLPILAKAGIRLPFEQRHAYYQPDPLLKSELAMVKRYCGDEAGKCLLLNRRQGIYSLEASTVSALKGPSPMELVLKKDLDRLKYDIRNGHYNKILLGIGAKGKVEHLELDTIDFRRYRNASINKERSLVLLLRK